MKKIAWLLLIACSIGLSANAQYGSHPCRSNLGLIPDGGSLFGYPAQQVPAGEYCQMISLSCHDGVLSGPDLFPTCNTLARNCGAVPDGGSVFGYTSSTPPCIAVTVFCFNGNLTGPMPVPFCNDFR